MPGQNRTRDEQGESLMLTGDENIVDLDFDVVWQVNPARAQDFVFNLQNPQGTIKSVAESAMREVIGRRNIQAILTTEQSSVAQEVAPDHAADARRLWRRRARKTSCSFRRRSRRPRCGRPSST